MRFLLASTVYAKVLSDRVPARPLRCGAVGSPGRNRAGLAGASAVVIWELRDTWVIAAGSGPAIASPGSPGRR